MNVPVVQLVEVDSGVRWLRGHASGSVGLWNETGEEAVAACPGLLKVAGFEGEAEAL